jgi:hypothetical protein
MRAAIIQSCYVPWKGYFDIIRSVDHFILFDDAQFRRGDFRNRNQIKTANGLKWITIPIAHSGVYPERIMDMRIGDPDWSRRHYEMIRQSYRGAPGWPVLDAWLNEVLLAQRAPTLTELNESLLRSLCGLLGIRTGFSRSVDHGVQCDDPTERLIRLCQAVGATHYVSGPSAKNYMREELFAENGMTFEYFDYRGYVEYPQPHGPFVHNVSILDAIACLGTGAHRALDRVAPATPA